MNNSKSENVEHPFSEALLLLLKAAEIEAQNQVSKIQSASDAKYDELNRRLTVLENSTAATEMLQDFKNNKDGQIRDLKSQNHELESENQVNKEKIDNLISQHKKTIETLINKHNADIDGLQVKHDAEIKKLNNDLSQIKIEKLALSKELQRYKDNIMDVSYELFINEYKEKLELRNYETFILDYTSEQGIIEFYHVLKNGVITLNTYDRKYDDFIDSVMIPSYNNINLKKIKRQNVGIGDIYSEQLYHKTEASVSNGKIKKVIVRGIAREDNSVFGDCTSLVEVVE